MSEKTNATVEVKIGRHTYDISSDDVFMDNGSCVQLVTQSKERLDWGVRPNPVLSKRAMVELAKFKCIHRETSRESWVKVFSFDIDGGAKK